MTDDESWLTTGSVIPTSPWKCPGLPSWGDEVVALEGCGEKRARGEKLPWDDPTWQEEIRPCRPPIRRRPTETVRQFIERAMAENHGYTVPTRWLADLDGIPDEDTGEPQSGYLVGVDSPTVQEGALLRRLTQEFGGGPATTDPKNIADHRPEQEAD